MKEGASSVQRTAFARLPAPDGRMLSVSYRLVRRKRKTIGLKIDGQGLVISASPRISIHEIEIVIQKKIRWIQKKNEEVNALKNECSSFRFCDGGSLPFRGRMLQISLDSGVAEPCLRSVAQGSLVLALPLSRDAISSEIKVMALDWLKKNAAVVIESRLHHMELFAPAKATSFALTSARTFWGKCHRSGLIRLNWQLIFFDNEIIDYVAAHELAHLIEMNHSPAFWEIVKMIKPNYEKAAQFLKQARTISLS